MYVLVTAIGDKIGGRRVLLVPFIALTYANNNASAVTFCT